MPNSLLSRSHSPRIAVGSYFFGPADGKACVPDSSSGASPNSSPKLSGASAPCVSFRLSSNLTTFWGLISSYFGRPELVAGRYVGAGTSKSK